jgi:hypothetical protein
MSLSRVAGKGANGIRFNRRAALRSGRYVALVRAVDAAGRRSAVRSVKFTVVGAR